jgi:putative AdoMet-dependent methyltransferase
VLDEIFRWAGAKPHMHVLDLGIGTGSLSARFIRRECAVWGVDFSARMLAKAREKLPNVRLLRAELLDDWPAELRRRFDRVVSAYVFHEFDLEAKIRPLQKIALQHLTDDGRILVGDVAFETADARAEAERLRAEVWDEEEFYWAADETIAACERAGLRAAYRQVSTVAGVFAFTHSQAT